MSSLVRRIQIRLLRRAIPILDAAEWNKRNPDKKQLRDVRHAFASNQLAFVGDKRIFPDDVPHFIDRFPLLELLLKDYNDDQAQLVQTK